VKVKEEGEGWEEREGGKKMKGTVQRRGRRGGEERKREGGG